MLLPSVLTRGEGTALTGSYSGLCRDGLVERAGSEEDRRVVLVRVTKAGRKKVAELKEPLVLLGEQQFAGMSRKEGGNADQAVADRLIVEGIPMDGFCIYRGQTLALEMRLHSDRAYYPTVLGLPQDRTEAIMAERLSELRCDVHNGLALESFGEQGDCVVAKFADGTEQQFDMIIGADGIKSTVRAKAGIGYPGVDLERTWSIADIDAEA